MAARRGAAGCEPPLEGWILLPLVNLAFAIITVCPLCAHEESAAHRLRHAQPARTGAAAPDRTGSLSAAGPARPAAISAAPTAVAPAGGKAQDDGPLLPILLPAAPRSRMLACGESWHVMKMQGVTGDESWRDYALKCLVAKAPPAP